MRALIVASAALLTACSAEPGATPTKVEGALQPVSITLPAETAALPATPAGELVTQRCTACHSADMIARQPPLTAEKWQATVTKMREAYHAPITPADEPAIVAALVTLQGAPPPR
ncbi:cytochrome C nitrite reductase [Sphingomonas sp. RHCKR47]|uniref:cytochrome C nitrite reductase n=1 Tax=Sphingomonas citricola TaxID=2862498 RepID=UPI001CA4C9E4|nr:cytochrome C nitrite reductase [Sphingomonas citricola]MBW6522085.1 cytochrome C nitrite reductase [Sphingomonas citricola]